VHRGREKTGGRIDVVVVVVVVVVLEPTAT
jgi:hypothetical protein